VTVTSSVSASDNVAVIVADPPFSEMFVLEAPDVPTVRVTVPACRVSPVERREKKTAKASKIRLVFMLEVRTILGIGSVPAFST
jgi:hypothetical protein